MKILELEYRGLNLLDEISTVEIAVDTFHKMIHIYDVNQVVEPEYNFTTKKYQMSEGFYKMAKVLNQKQFLKLSSESEEQWIKELIWIFYGSRKSILKYNGTDTTEIPKAAELAGELYKDLHLYTKYYLRII